MVNNSPPILYIEVQTFHPEKLLLVQGFTQLIMFSQTWLACSLRIIRKFCSLESRVYLIIENGHHFKDFIGSGLLYIFFYHKEGKLVRDCGGGGGDKEG